MTFIPHPLVLTGSKVTLKPMEAYCFEGIWQVANDARIWEFTSQKLNNRELYFAHLENALKKRATGDVYQLVIEDTKTKTFIGSTMFHSIVPENRKLEIGWTWYRPEYMRTGCNRECKLLMLTYCFETLLLKRVQFQIDELNKPSWNALLGIGATFEGIIRHERMRPDGTCRNTAMFSVIDTEWVAVKQNLVSKIIL